MSREEMIRSIVFDWGGVLIRNPTAALFRFCATTLQVSPKKFRETYEQYAPDFQKGTLSEHQLWSHLSAEFHTTQPSHPSL